MGNFEMRKIQWICDTVLLDRHDEFGFPALHDAAFEDGHALLTTKYVPFCGELTDYQKEDIKGFFRRDMPLVTYGCVGFLKAFKKINSMEMCPGSYFKIDELKYSAAATHYGADMLNHEGMFLPYAEIIRRVKEKKNNPRIFMRPDGVTKAFAGRVFDFDDPSETPEALNQYDPISPDEMCFFATPKEILGEYRHVICEHEVIAQSQYRWNGKLDIRTDVHNDCLRLAKEVSRNEWQPDYVYVVDTALTKDGPFIVEFNSFSCSGLYACNTKRIVERVAAAAWNEFEGNL